MHKPQPVYQKSFSKGQITIPKAIRDELGIGDQFWLKIFVQNGAIVAVPQQESQSKQTYVQSLLSISGDWLDTVEVDKNRKQIESHLKKNQL